MESRVPSTSSELGPRRAAACRGGSRGLLRSFGSSPMTSLQTVTWPFRAPRSSSTTHVRVQTCLVRVTQPPKLHLPRLHKGDSCGACGKGTGTRAEGRTEQRTNGSGGPRPGLIHSQPSGRPRLQGFPQAQSPPTPGASRSVCKARPGGKNPKCPREACSQLPRRRTAAAEPARPLPVPRVVAGPRACRVELWDCRSRPCRKPRRFRTTPRPRLFRPRPAAGDPRIAPCVPEAP